MVRDVREQGLGAEASLGSLDCSLILVNFFYIPNIPNFKVEMFAM